MLPKSQKDYVPSLGRCITPDPIGLAGGLNMYSYVGNNPINYIDMWGLAWFRPEGHEYLAGRENSDLVAPGVGIGKIIDDYVPAGHTFASVHDRFVGAATDKGWPDWLVNIPSMVPAYYYAVEKEYLNTLLNNRIFGIDYFEHRLEDDYPKEVEIGCAKKQIRREVQNAKIIKSSIYPNPVGPNDLSLYIMSY